MTHNEDFVENNLQMSFRQCTTLTSFRGLIPNPPSAFGRHTSFQLTFAFVVFNSGTDHRNAENKRSISFKQLPGSRKADIQKFARLVITELISCSLPARDRNLPVHEPIIFLIFPQAAGSHLPSFIL